MICCIEEIEKAVLFSGVCRERGCLFAYRDFYTTGIAGFFKIRFMASR